MARSECIVSAVALLLLLSPLLICDTSDASVDIPTEQGIDISYEIIPDTETVRTVATYTYTGDEKELNIPSSIIIGDMQYDVAEIGDSSFRSWNITSVTIPETVKLIGENAFQGCYGVKDITFQGTIADDAIKANAFSLGMPTHPAECTMHGFVPTRDVGQTGNPYEDIFGEYTEVTYADLTPNDRDAVIHVAILVVGVIFLLYMGRAVKVKKIKRKKVRKKR